MNSVEKLLKLDAGKIVMPTKVVTLKLGKLDGLKLDFECKAVDPEKYSEIQENSLEIKKGDIKKINMHNTKVLTLIEGCPGVFKSKEVQEHFGCPTPKELVNKLLLSGEIDELYNNIVELSGYEKDEESDIKN
ncbi:MAG: XkdN-like protein [Bacillota bacterium]|nr:XkdN-like protein [Bacillota bacterium]